VLLGVLGAVAVLLIVAYHSASRTRSCSSSAARRSASSRHPDVQLNPEVVLVIVLPPLLYAAAFFSSLRDLRDNLRAISLLAIGLVIVTMLGGRRRRPRGHRRDVVGGGVRARRRRVAHRPVAATAIASRVGRAAALRDDRRGRGAVNDATALVAYKFASRPWSPGSFSLAEAAGASCSTRSSASRSGSPSATSSPAAQGARRRADGDHDLAGHAVLRLPAGRGAGRLRRARGA
jgi:CPA1 family monovalent cation:H+ antiporter